MKQTRSDTKKTKRHGRCRNDAERFIKRMKVRRAKGLPVRRCRCPWFIRRRMGEESLLFKTSPRADIPMVKTPLKDNTGEKMDVVDEFSKPIPDETAQTISAVQSSKRMLILQKQITDLSKKIKELEQLKFDIEMKRPVKSDVDVEECERTQIKSVLN